MHGLTEASFAALDHRLAPGSGAPVVLGLSGGGDSMALLLMAAAWARLRRRPLIALTVDHRLQAESGAWTAFAGEAARRAGADWRALAWEGEKPISGLPAAARAARHRLLAEAARAVGAAVILLAHTADDQLEGDLMRAADAPRLGRLRAWSPSPVWPEGRGLFLLRPLLGVRRAALRGWLQQQGQDWLEDPANEDLRHARARARASLAVRPSDVAVREARCERTLPGAETVRGDAAGVLRISRRDLDKEDEDVRRLLSLMIVCASGAEVPPRGEALERLRLRLADRRPFVASLGGARLMAGEQEVAVAREAGEFARGPRPALFVPSRGRTVWDGRFEVAADGELTVAPLAGLAARLPPAERARLSRRPAAVRAALPALLIGEAVRLPRPFGDGPASATCLVEARFAAAAGLIRREHDIKPACDGRSGMAQGLQSSYVERLALA